MVDREPTTKDLERAEFYANLHKKVSGGLLSVEAANEQVKQYDYLQHHLQPMPIPGTPWTINRFW